MGTTGSSVSLEVESQGSGAVVGSNPCTSLKQVGPSSVLYAPDATPKEREDTGVTGKTAQGENKN